MPNPPKLRAFEVIALKVFSNFHVLKRFIVVSETRPVPQDIGLKENEELMEIRELNAEVVVK